MPRYGIQFPAHLKNCGVQTKIGAFKLDDKGQVWGLTLEQQEALGKQPGRLPLIDDADVQAAVQAVAKAAVPTPPIMAETHPEREDEAVPPPGDLAGVDEPPVDVEADDPAPADAAPESPEPVEAEAAADAGAPKARGGARKKR